MNANANNRNVLPGMEAFLDDPHGPPWYANRSARDVAAVFDVTVQAIDSWTRTGCPVDRHNNRLIFDLRAVIAWRRERDMSRFSGSEDGDPLLSAPAGESEALEDYRRAKAKLAWLDYQNKRGQLIDLETVNANMRLAAQRLRDAFERVARLHGQAVAATLYEALDDAIGQIATVAESGDATPITPEAPE